MQILTQQYQFKIRIPVITGDYLNYENLLQNKQMADTNIYLPKEDTSKNNTKELVHAWFGV